jgi:hypothetical protein
MGDVIELKRPERGDLVWICTCGCSTHKHHSDGRVECAACGNIASVSNDGWRALLPPLPDEPPPVPEMVFKVLSIDTAETFMRRRIKDGDPIETVIIVHTDGRCSTWSNADARSQAEQTRKRVDDAVELLLGTHKPS